MTDFLSVDDLLEIADGILPEVLVQDVGLVSSAADRPRATVLGEDAYPTLHEKAAALMHSLARNHPLVDGNKRLAWSATRVLLMLNGSDVGYASVDDAEQLVLAVSRGELEVPDIAAWLRANERLPRD